MVATYNLSTEDEIGGSEVQDHSWLYIEPMSSLDMCLRKALNCLLPLLALLVYTPIQTLAC